MTLSLDINEASTFKQACTVIAEGLIARQKTLPSDKAARIVLKPNLNSFMNGLTGNTTDLRVISALLKALKDMGYTSLTIAEGTNSGFSRNNIGVIHRLRVDTLADHYGASVVDCNHTSGRPISFGNNVTAQVAATCMDAEFLINIPKLKTHFEAGMSVCLKNLIGCLIGQENKRKTHQDLPGNIVRLNQALRPHLHVVDAMISMEGCGPSRGTPVPSGMLIIGDDPYLIDLACARLTGIDPGIITPLVFARNQGLLTDAHFEAVDAIGRQAFSRQFERAKPSMAARIAHLSPASGLLRSLRESALGTWLASTAFFGRVLYLSGIRQDAFDAMDSDIKGVRVNARCNQCGICRDFCPIGADPSQGPGVNNAPCIACLYCFMVCPQKALEVDGELGFIEEQMQQYDALIRRQASRPGEQKAD
jgi:Uncharacterized conserved protein